MNKDVYEKAMALHQWIMEQEVVQEYQKYEHQMSSHQELKDLEETLKQLQQKIVQAKHTQLDCHELIQEYEVKKKAFDQHPLVYNYLILKEEVNTLLHQIQDDINLELKKRVDESMKTLYNFFNK